uniref:Uncharacterized protein n=1 Tax=Nicotiana tabacum TaxID=4097 RepID=A0A1S3XD44_TOBAC
LAKREVRTPNSIEHTISSHRHDSSTCLTTGPSIYNLQRTEIPNENQRFTSASVHKRGTISFSPFKLPTSVYAELAMEMEYFPEAMPEEESCSFDENNDDYSSLDGERCGICMDVVIDRGVLDCCQH